MADNRSGGHYNNIFSRNNRPLFGGNIFTGTTWYSIEEQINAITTSEARLSDYVSVIENNVIALDTTAETHETRLDELDTEVEHLGTTAESHETRLDDIQAEIDDTILPDLAELSSIIFVDYLVPPTGLLVLGSMQNVLSIAAAAAATAVAGVGTLGISVALLDSNKLDKTATILPPSFLSSSLTSQIGRAHV